MAKDWMTRTHHLGEYAKLLREERCLKIFAEFKSALGRDFARVIQAEGIGRESAELQSAGKLEGSGWFSMCRAESGLFSTRFLAGFSEEFLPDIPEGTTSALALAIRRAFVDGISELVFRQLEMAISDIILDIRLEEAETIPGPEKFIGFVGNPPCVLARFPVRLPGRMATFGLAIPFGRVRPVLMALKCGCAVCGADTKGLAAMQAEREARKGARIGRAVRMLSLALNGGLK